MVYSPSAVVRRLAGYSSAELDFSEHYFLAVANCGFIAAGVLCLLAVLVVVFKVVHWCCCARFVTGEPQQSCCYGKFWRGSLLLCLLVTAGVILGALDGEDMFQRGNTDLQKATDELEAVFHGLDTHGSELSSQGAQLSSIATGSDLSTCPVAVQNAIVLAAGQFTQQADQTQSYWAGVSGHLKDAQDLRRQANITVEALVGVLVGLVLLVCLLGALGALCRKGGRCCLCLTSVLGGLLVVPLGGLIGVQLAFSVFLADYCMEPDQATVTAATKVFGDAGDGDALQATRYYVDCAGTNPILSALGKATQQAEYLSNTAPPGPVGASCQAGLDALHQVGKDAVTSLNGVQATIACPEVNAPYQIAVYEAMCKDLVDGLYTSWSVEAAAACGLALAAVLTTLVREEIAAADERRSLMCYNEEQRQLGGRMAVRAV